MKLVNKLQEQDLKTSKKIKINVFLTTNEYKKLNEIRHKYELSYSTIVSIILQEYQPFKQLTDLANSGRLIKQNKANKKTSIKPIQKNYIEFTPKAIYYENMIHIFCNDEVKNYLPEKIANKIKNKIYNRFQITRDPMFDYNEFIRKSWIYEKYRRKAKL